MDQVKEYINAQDVQTQDTLYVFDEFSDEISIMHGKCIDIGCGPGLGSRRLLSRLPVDSIAIGADISKKMIEFAQTKFADEKRLSFIELDITAEKLPPHLIGAFHNAVSFYCLQWCSNLGQAFENINKLLRPGGKALVLFVAKHIIYETYSKLHDYPEYQAYMKDYLNFIPYFQNHNDARTELKKLIEESGFEVLHCSNRERTFIFENWDNMKHHVLAINPFIKRMPEDVQEKYKEDLLQELKNSEHAFLKSGKESSKQLKIMDKYNLLLAYFKKPAVSKNCK